MSVQPTTPQATYTLTAQTNLDTLDTSMLTTADQDALKAVKDGFAALVLSLGQYNDGSWTGYDWREHDRNG